MTLPPPTVAVSATARREVAPDRVELHAQVSTSNREARAALATLVDRYGTLERIAEGFPAAVTVEHGPVSRWASGDKHRMFEASRRMTVRSSDVALVAELADALTGPDVAQVSGPYWSVSRENVAHDELQAEAVHEARRRAERYAAALDGTLGALVELSDPGTGGDFHAMPVAAAAMMRRGGSDPEMSDLDLTPQPQELAATVNARWALTLPA
jgi:uncharacterized protein